MAELRIYDRAAVRVAGRYITHATGIRVSYQSSDQAITLLGGGTKKTFALVPGSRLIIIQWDMVVPTDDTADLAFIRSYLDCDRVKVGIDLFGSGESLTSEGFLKEPTLNGRVGSNVEYTISFVGEQASF